MKIHDSGDTQLSYVKENVDSDITHEIVESMDVSDNNDNFKFNR